MKARILAHICLTPVHSFFLPVQHRLLQRMKGIAEETNTAEGKGRESQRRHKQSTTRKKGCSCGWPCSPPTQSRIFSFLISSLPVVKVNEFGLTQLILWFTQPTRAMLHAAIYRGASKQLGKTLLQKCRGSLIIPVLSWLRSSGTLCGKGIPWCKRVQFSSSV